MAEPQSLFFLVPIEPRSAEAWADSSHVGVIAIHAETDSAARRMAAASFSEGPDSPWLDSSLSLCFPATPEGASGAIYFAPDARMKTQKNPIPGDAEATADDISLRGPGAFTAPPALEPAARDRYIAKALDPETGLRSDIEPRAFLGAAADATVISYPKSGKTWLAYLVTSYIASYLGFADLFHELTGEGGLRTFAPESRRGYLGAVAARRTPQKWAPLIRFVHQDSLGYPYFAPKTLGAPGTARHVLLVRDPRDVLVSHFHHIVIKNKGVFDAHREKPRLAEDTELSEFIRSDFLGIRHLLLYYEGWGRWAEAHPGSVFHYEDFVSEPKETLARLLAWLGVSEVVDAHLDAAIDASSFGKLQAAERSTQLSQGKDDNASTRRMRRGKAGGYRDEVSAEDAAFMTRVMQRADIPILRRYLAETG